jgi:hypothetical protein
MVDPPNIGFGVTGVAPEASLYMYRIFSCVSDDTTDNIIMDAMIQAAADRVDVISIVDLASLASIHSFHLKFNH